MRALILRGGPWTEDERTAILDYCEADVEALERLLPAMLPKLDLPRALLRGRYMAAAAAMEHAGTPIDVDMLELFRRHWTDIQDQLISRDRRRLWRLSKAAPSRPTVLPPGSPPTISPGHCSRAATLISATTRSGNKPAPIRRCRRCASCALSLSDLRLNDLAVGPTDEIAQYCQRFRSRTGRNQPIKCKFIFGPSVWLRGLIKPPPGHAVAYVDWSQQEIGIAAALSGDHALQAAYRSGDCYLAFAKQAGAVPQDATKATHGAQRELFKQCMLAVQYGMEAQSLALRIAQPALSRAICYGLTARPTAAFGTGPTPLSIRPCF